MGIIFGIGLLVIGGLIGAAIVYGIFVHTLMGMWH